MMAPAFEIKSTAMPLHTTHDNIVHRLKRAEGHLRSIVAMIQEGRECMDIAQQLAAVEKAISNAKKTLVHDHIDHCLKEAVGQSSRNSQDVVREFKEITKYL